jgi:hypothetical protein
MKSPWIITALVAVGTFVGGYAIAQRVDRSSNAETQTVKDNSAVAKLNEQMAQQIQQIDFLKNTNTSLTQDRDTCQAKFQRSTILYDGSVFESRRWIIPADVEPVLFTPERLASFSHYDPKTQTETMKFIPKPAH